ncbi:Putative transglycosylase SLT domain 1, Lysozyme-like domain superfamily [Septoria linicola]|uniref:Transglycosylase SLT domain 1, Lysozyme-like domain superfamily n=1 Tax=Septoria linicola TaxID=215465 RepID=A0A9Q9EEY7_9PEZI|nr:Putative transglycosylase SLT domain 1, Lysozyme-like domain superfamily [Septoria linicola]
MAVFSMLCVMTALLAAQVSFAAPVTRSESCDFGAATPPGWNGPMQSQWCGMLDGEVNALRLSEDLTTRLPIVVAQYASANIKVSPETAFPKLDEITQDPSARAAIAQMKVNFPQFGSMDLTPENIQIVYADHIKAACSKTGVPEDMMVKMIWTESKGHPLVYHGLTQMDYVAWGQMADQDSSLKNRYMPGDNILAAAMYMKRQKDQFGSDWETTYTQHYQDPKARTYQ